METIKACPIDTALRYIGKKWSIQIIRDLFMGKKRFKDFLNSNPGLSTKVLSTRLKELESLEIINKDVTSGDTVQISYVLTSKGRRLNKVLYELIVFSMHECPKEVFGKCCSPKEHLTKAKELFLKSSSPKR
ncbi:transcriptional regulator [archaeon]|nr:transcriptional regulator [archaeon]|tara:strand:+ start:4456 stop:4851 length:396 start_codon:yes stop_codon:yes gene_type:complete